MRLRFTLDRISCNWVPSPQSNRKTSPSRTTAVADRPRVRVGTAELVPSRTIRIMVVHQTPELNTQLSRSKESGLAILRPKYEKEDRGGADVYRPVYVTGSPR